MKNYTFTATRVTDNHVMTCTYTDKQTAQNNAKWLKGLKESGRNKYRVSKVEAVKSKFWTDGNGYIELALTEEIVNMCHHSGPCDDDCERWAVMPEVSTQFDKISNDTMIKVLSEYGAWPVDELQDNQQNRIRILWIAAGDIQERPEDYTN